MCSQVGEYPVRHPRHRTCRRALENKTHSSVDGYAVKRAPNAKCSILPDLQSKNANFPTPKKFIFFPTVMFGYPSSMPVHEDRNDAMKDEEG
jgi:hypothetical protein